MVFAGYQQEKNKNGAAFKGYAVLKSNSN